MDEKEIVERLRGGDTGCLEHIVATYGGAIFNLVRRIVDCEDDAKEVTQDIFMKVYANVGKWRGECALSTWIYRMAYNEAISSLRGGRKRGVAVDRGVELDRVTVEVAEYNTAREAQYVALERAIARLPDDERLLINLYYYANKSVDELASILSIRQSNVKVKLFRIRKKLHENLQ